MIWKLTDPKPDLSLIAKHNDFHVTTYWVTVFLETPLQTHSYPGAYPEVKPFGPVTYLYVCGTPMLTAAGSPSFLPRLDCEWLWHESVGRWKVSDAAILLTALTILTPPFEPPDPPNNTPGASKQVVLIPHDISRILREYLTAVGMVELVDIGSSNMTKQWALKLVNYYDYD